MVNSIKQFKSWIVSTIIAVRLAAAPLFVILFLDDQNGWALALFLLAVFTDALDGYVARRIGGAAIILGPFSDAIADFVLVLGAFFAFVVEGIYPSWILLLFMAMFAQFVVTSRLGRPIYDSIGKYYGVFLFAAIGMTLIFPYSLIYKSVLLAVLGFSIASLSSRIIFLVGGFKKIGLNR